MNIEVKVLVDGVEMILTNQVQLEDMSTGKTLRKKSLEPDIKRLHFLELDEIMLFDDPEVKGRPSKMATSVAVWHKLHREDPRRFKATRIDSKRSCVVRIR